MSADLLERARAAVTVKEALAPCETCQGNGEIVTDWEHYLRPRKGDVGDEDVAECPDCDGRGAPAAQEGEKPNG